MLATPIFINTMVVFVRLYWFEKRFQHIVKEAQNLRRSRSRSRSNTMTINEKDLGTEEEGVNGRRITVLRGRKMGEELPNGQNADLVDRENRGSGSEISLEDLKKVVSAPSAPVDASKQCPEIQGSNKQTFHRDITFADELPEDNRGERFSAPTYEQLDADGHIAFLENQRNPKDKGTLRIPGPREYDRGIVPEIVPETDDSSKGIPLSTEKNPVQHHSTNNNAEEPHSSPVFAIRFRKSTGKHSQETPALAPSSSCVRSRSKSGTAASLKAAVSKENVYAPYLSWQPTIGRNSTFLGLTEEQRDELGGIEYRSLKSLAVILVSKSNFNKPFPP